MAFGIIVVYFVLLLFLGVFAGRLLLRTSGDYFVASRGIGSFMLFMSIFGTTMTAFALIGSTGKTFEKGIGVYGMLASWSGIVHAAVFFLVGVKVWSLGKQHGYLTQISYFRDRYQSDALALLLFPIMVGFVVIYILVGVIGGGKFLNKVTQETFTFADSRVAVAIDIPEGALTVPDALRDHVSYDGVRKELVATGSFNDRHDVAFLAANPELARRPEFRDALKRLFELKPNGGVPYPLGMALISVVVLIYVFFGGMRATAWANTFQTIVFMGMGIVAFIVIMNELGGPIEATRRLIDHPEGSKRLARDGMMRPWQFLTYGLIPISAGMFPHLFQHWLTARKASNFKLTVIAHPICIMITWLPCVLLGMWASALLPINMAPNGVLGAMVSRYSNEVLAGLIGAGVLAAIMSSMDSQFLCLSSLFTNDIVEPYFSKGRIDEQKKVFIGRTFVVIVVAATCVLGYFAPAPVFDLGVWCFTGFSGLFPVLFAALYWRRSNKQGAIAATITVAAMWLAFLPQVLYRPIGGEEEFLLFDIGLMPVSIIVAASIVVLIIVTVVTPRPSSEIVRKFFPDRK
jgi:SSS family solute:Na+ symporter